MDLQYSKTNQSALQADEITPLNVIGDVTGVKINKGSFVFTLDALVIKSDMTYIIAGDLRDLRDLLNSQFYNTSASYKIIYIICAGKNSLFITLLLSNRWGFCCPSRIFMNFFLVPP